MTSEKPPSVHDLSLKVILNITKQIKKKKRFCPYLYREQKIKVNFDVTSVKTSKTKELIQNVIDAM